jgi:hypothetical protein
MIFRNRKVSVPAFLHELHGENAYLLTLIATYLSGLIAGIFIIGNIGFSTLSVWKTVLLFILYVDIAGGVVSNFSSSTSQYYQKNEKIRVPFILMHFLHPGLLILLFPISVYYFAYVGSYTIIACLIINKINNQENQQTWAALILVAGILSSFFFKLPFPGLYTFAPLFMIKLIMGFSVRRTLLSTI